MLGDDRVLLVAVGEELILFRRASQVNGGKQLVQASNDKLQLGGCLICGDAAVHLAGGEIIDVHFHGSKCS